MKNKSENESDPFFADPVDPRVEAQTQAGEAICCFLIWMADAPTLEDRGLRATVALYNGFNGQKWDITHVGNGQYRMANVANGKVIDVAGISTANGAKLTLWDWLNGNNQKWTFTAAGDGYWKITAIHSRTVAVAHTVVT